MKTFVIDREEVLKIKVGDDSAPTNAHRLYSWLSHQFNGSIIVDAGTSNGKSAKAFAANSTNLVITYDYLPIKTHSATLTRLSPLNNVIWKQLDCNLIEPQWFSHVDIILLDIDPHDGIQEAEFLKRIESHFKGILIMDDVADHKIPTRWPALFHLFNQLDREHHIVRGVADGGIGIVPYGDWTVVIK